MGNYEFHQPVMAQAAVDYLITTPEGIYVDCTVGGTGHSQLILKNITPGGRLVCIDADADAIHFAQQRLQTHPNVILRRSFFDQLDVILKNEKLLPVHGFLFDLGISSFQIDRPEKGFSFQSDGPLDMRFNQRQSLSALEVVNQYPQEKLEQIFWKYGEEKKGRAIARKIVEQRRNGIIDTTRRLTEVIRLSVSPRYINKTLARIFQAIRIEVNDELARLKRALEKAFSCLDHSGRLVVISYHSLEDRIVKDFFRDKERDCICPPEFPQCVCDKVSELQVLTKKPLLPASVEMEQNPRSRSAKLRAAQKIVEYRELV
jgi:16S rRNA (cytosine1402-N4)-methyltransferase